MPYILPSGSPERGYIVVSGYVFSGGYADQGYVSPAGFAGGYILSGG